MRRILTPTLLAAAMAVSPLVAQKAEANVIKRACLKADRAAATRALCGCIQDVADVTLSRTEQRKGAKFFKEPHLAQETRQSDRPSNETFWKKWKNFGFAANSHCG